MHSYYFITVLFDKRWRCVTKVNKYLSNIQYEDAVAYPTYVSRCLTLRAQCLAFMQIRPLEY
ncbi:hypothetical protein T02_3806 [Trichinella nativa]|uniref:Uncharacterized protein n=1 Tax=Trichinella nativa TaxID=6335 RepID=A0A0V1LI78_9BILA|nr:hypothetical protein T02_3806 [Trichinella nativa]